MARKVFISVLGYSNYSECIYTKEKYKSPSVRFVQEATLDYLCKKEDWTENDVAYILLTKGAERKNWFDDGHQDYTTKEIIHSEGLCSRLNRNRFPINVVPLNNLPDGNNEDEIWEIFERVHEVIEEGDELYFDLTHGFRYLPMLVMVLINYSKFLKNTTVKSITYGNYESRSKESNEAPIIDLLPLSSLQDWTFASGQFLESGNVNRLTSLCNQEIKPILKESAGKDMGASTLRDFVKYLSEVIEERQSCRGMNIIASTNLSKLKKISSVLESTIIPPLNPVLNEIKKSLQNFDDKENVRNAFAASAWCFQNNMLQQSATILQEFVISFFCSRHDIKIDDEDRRNLITSAFTIRFFDLKEEQWKNSGEDKTTIKQILSDDLFVSKELINLFNNLTEIRNDLNHSGMRSKRPPLKHKAIKDNIEKCISGFYRILYYEEGK